MARVGKTTTGRKISLIDIDWQETSGVNHPANEVEAAGETGAWMVLKAASADQAGTEVSNEVVDDSEVIAELLDDYLDSAPDSVVKAAQVVVDYIATQSDEEPVEKAAKSPKPMRFVNFLKSLVNKESDQNKEEVNLQEKLDIFIKGLHPGMSATDKWEAVQNLKKSLTERGE